MPNASRTNRICEGEREKKKRERERELRCFGVLFGFDVVLVKQKYAEMGTKNGEWRKEGKWKG